jgi:hypothetical protein
MASSSFRDSIGTLGWTRRDQDIPVNTSQQSGLLSSIKSLNPFQDRGYVRLPTTEGAGAPLPAPSRREEEEGMFVCESFGLFVLPFFTFARFDSPCSGACTSEISHVLVLACEHFGATNSYSLCRHYSGLYY